MAEAELHRKLDAILAAQEAAQLGLQSLEEAMRCVVRALDGPIAQHLGRISEGVNLLLQATGVEVKHDGSLADALEQLLAALETNGAQLEAIHRLVQQQSQMTEDAVFTGVRRALQEA